MYLFCSCWSNCVEVCSFSFNCCCGYFVLKKTTWPLVKYQSCCSVWHCISFSIFIFICMRSRRPFLVLNVCLHLLTKSVSITLSIIIITQWVRPDVLSIHWFHNQNLIFFTRNVFLETNFKSKFLIKHVDSFDFIILQRLYQKSSIYVFYNKKGFIKKKNNDCDFKFQSFFCKKTFKIKKIWVINDDSSWLNNKNFIIKWVILNDFFEKIKFKDIF